MPCPRAVERHPHMPALAGSDVSGWANQRASTPRTGSSATASRTRLRRDRRLLGQRGVGGSLGRRTPPAGSRPVARRDADDDNDLAGGVPGCRDHRASRSSTRLPLGGQLALPRHPHHPSRAGTGRPSPGTPGALAAPALPAIRAIDVIHVEGQPSDGARVDDGAVLDSSADAVVHRASAVCRGRREL